MEKEISWKSDGQEEFELTKMKTDTSAYVDSYKGHIFVISPLREITAYRILDKSMVRSWQYSSPEEPNQIFWHPRLRYARISQGYFFWDDSILFLTQEKDALFLTRSQVDGGRRIWKTVVPGINELIQRVYIFCLNGKDIYVWITTIGSKSPGGSKQVKSNQWVAPVEGKIFLLDPYSGRLTATWHPLVTTDLAAHGVVVTETEHLRIFEAYQNSLKVEAK